MSISAQSIGKQLKFACITASCPEFKQILTLRESAYEQEFAGEKEPVDDYSDHYICRLNGEIVGALRSTRKKEGMLESESAYPNWIIDNFSEQLCGSSRLCINPKLKGANKIPLPLIRFAWTVALGKGIRLDVSKVRLEAVPFYLRLGYYFVADSLFDFDRSATVCALVAFPANADRKSPISDLFEKITHPLRLDAPEFEHRLTNDYRSFRSQSKEFKAQQMTKKQSHQTPKEN